MQGGVWSNEVECYGLLEHFWSIPHATKKLKKIS